MLQGFKRKNMVEGSDGNITMHILFWQRAGDFSCKNEVRTDKCLLDLSAVIQE